MLKLPERAGGLIKYPADSICFIAQLMLDIYKGGPKKVYFCQVQPKLKLNLRLNYPYFHLIQHPTKPLPSIKAYLLAYINPIVTKL